jgi:hypothetical protein
MIVPTVGRVIWFRPSIHDEGLIHHDKTQPLAAMICHVWGDRLVNLMVIDGNGGTQGKTSVPLLQEGESLPESGFFCSWMPFQLGQAAKHAASAAS